MLKVVEPLFAPEGQPDSSQRLQPTFSYRPYGTNLIFMPHPALKDRATIRLPLRGKDSRAKINCLSGVITIAPL
jgi:hypothetical protein